MGTVHAGQPLEEAARSLGQAFEQAGLDSPMADARTLLGQAVGLSGGELVHARLTGACLSEDDAARLESMAARRVERVPLQHITGTAPFRYLELQVGPGCLIPRPETELLVEAVLAHLNSAGFGPDRPARVLDVGTGSGAIALSLATERPGTRVTAVDLSEGALAWAAKNCLGTDVQLLLADGTRPREEFERAFDVVVTNPPYVPDDERPTQPEAHWDPEMALYGGSPDGLRIPLLMADRAAEWLRIGGLFAMEHAERQGRAVRQRLGELGFKDIRTLPDLTGRERMSIGTLAGE